MNENALYVEGEERFGWMLSSLYVAGRLLPIMRRFYRFVLSDMKERSFSTLLDIGCGDGYVLRRLATVNREFSGKGIDPSRHMISIARKKARRDGISNLEFELGSSRMIPGKEKFDIIISSLSFHHWHGREEAIAEITGRLNEGGHFIVYEFRAGSGMMQRLGKSHMVSEEFFRNLPLGESVRLEEIAVRGNYLYSAFARKV